MSSSTHGAASGAPMAIWIPVDVKIHWFSFLSAKDLANCGRVCRSWVSLTTKAADAMITMTTCATSPPQLSRAGKMKLLYRLQNATEKENFGYLLSWAAGSREHLPFLHKLLLLRDVIREDLGLPGGLHETARPDAYDELDDSLKALFTYQSGKGEKVIEYVIQPPLIVAAQRGNVDAIHLLLLFGEGVHARRKGNDRALYVACEQGNVQCVAALLGRVPLRPPKHPAHSAFRLGLIRPVYSVYNAGYTYSSGISAGLLDVASAVSGAKIRAEFASATGISTGQGTRASLAASQAASSKGGQSFNAASDSPMSVTEIAVLQTEQFESDGRYRHWCRNYRMGTFWSTYDTALAAYEAIHGPIGEQADIAIPQFAQQQLARAAAVSSSSSGPSPYVTSGGSRQSVGGRGTGTIPVPAPKKKKSDINKLTTASLTVNLNNLKSRLEYRLSPGSHPFMIPRIHAHSLPPAFVSQALILDRLPGNSMLQMAARMRPRGQIHPRIPAPIDYGVIAADSIAIKVRLNIGPIEGRTPLLVAAERGRVEIAFLLLSHHDPFGTLSGVVPELVKKIEDDPSAPTTGAPAAPLGAGAQAAPGGAAPVAPVNLPLAITGPGIAAGVLTGATVAAGATAPVVIPPSVLAARAALAAIADASPSSLAVSPESLSAGSVASSGTYGMVVLGSNYSFQTVDQDSPLTVAHKKVLVSVNRRAEVLSELLKEKRDRVDVDMHPSNSHTPLCLAAERGDARLIQQLLHWGADPNLPGRKEARPLLVAAMAGHEKVIKLLLRISCAPPEAKAVANAIETIRELRKARKIAQSASASTNAGKRTKPGADTDDDDDDDDGGNDDLGNELDDDENSTSLARRGPQLKGSPLKPLYSPRPPPLHTTRRQLLASINDMEGSSTTDAICNVLGIGNSASDALRALKGQARGGRRRRKDKSSTAASAAMGSTIAVQNGRRKAAGDDEDDDGETGGDGTSGNDGSAKKEDFSINTCEPCVIATLAAAAISSSAGQLDEWGVPLPPARPPFNPSDLFLPVDEASYSNFDRSGTGPAVLEFYKDLKHLYRGSRESSYNALADTKKQRAPARVGGLASLLAIGTDKMTAHMKQIQQAADDAAAAAAETNAILSTADILSFPTAASYTEQVWHHDRFKAMVRSCCNNVLARSRIASGTGALEGRPTIIVDVGDESGYSALFILACAGKLHSVMLLVHAGADVTQATKRGKTPIYGAVEKCHTEVVEFLMPRYSASQLRANTTYGTNVIHAANKAGNSRIRDALQAYCVDYDMRQARMLKQEAAVRRKQMWGEGEGGNPGESGGHIAEGSEAAAHLAKLKRMAEVAKRKQEEKSWAQLRKLKGDAAVDEMIAAAEAGASPKAERGRTSEKGGEQAIKRATSITLAPEFTHAKPPKVAASKGSSTTASGKASSSRARSSSRDTAASLDDGASAGAETLSGDEARPVAVVKREKPTSDRGGIAIAKLTAAAAEARIEREKAAAAAAAPPKFGGIPASVYAAAAAAASKNGGNPLSSPPPPPPKSSSTTGPSLSSPTSGLSPYARRMDGTVSPTAASISHLSRPSGSNIDENGSKSSPSSGTSGTTSSSSPLSTHQVTSVIYAPSHSQHSTKNGKSLYKDINGATTKSTKPSATTMRPVSSDSGTISDVDSADTGTSSLTDSVFDRLATKAKDADLKKKLAPPPPASKVTASIGTNSTKPSISRSSSAPESASDVRTLARQELEDPASSASVSARAARAAYFDRLFVSSNNSNNNNNSSVSESKEMLSADYSSEPIRSGSPMRSPPRNLAALNTSNRSSGGASEWAQSVVRSSGLSTEDVDKMLADIDASQAKDKKDVKTLKSAAGGGARAVQSARAALITDDLLPSDKCDTNKAIGQGGTSPVSEPGSLPPRSILGQASGAQKNAAIIPKQNVSKAALLGAALGTAGMVPTMSGSNFVPARQALSLASKSTGHFDAAFSTQETRQPSAPLGQYGLEKGEMAAREERNRLREEQKLLKIQKAREDLEARSRELERQAAMHSKEMGLTSAATLAKAMAAYGGAYKK